MSTFFFLKFTWLKIENDILSWSFFLPGKKKVKIIDIEKILTRSMMAGYGAVSTKLIDIYMVDNKSRFTISPKPFTKQQIADLLKTLLEINPKIQLENRLLNY